jgi:hypothetical protein
MATLANQVYNGPVVFAPLQEVKSQLGKFPATQTAPQENGEKRSIALTFERLGPRRLPQTTSLLGRQPIPKADPELLCPLDPAYACGELGAQQPGVGSLISEPAHSGKPHVDSPRC